MAAVAGVAMLVAIGLFAVAKPSAFALGPPQVSTISPYPGGSCTPTVTTPCGPNTDAVLVFASAVNPGNGDVAFVNLAEDDVYLYAASTQPALGITAPVIGDTYLVAGNGGSGTTSFSTASAGVVATSTAVQPVALSFDNSGSLLLSLGANGSSQAPIAVVANSTGAAYGRTSLVVGDLYEVATTTASGINSPPTVLAPVVFVPGGLVEWPVSSLGVDAAGDVFLALPGNGIVVIDESTAKTAYGQALTPQTATFIVGNASTSDSAEALNITPAGQPATGAFIVTGDDLALDGYGNVVFTTSATTSGTEDTIFVLPAVSGTGYGLSMTAGKMYYLGGTPGTVDSENLNGVPAASASFAAPDALTVDSLGNIVVGDWSNLPSSAVAFIAETASGGPYGVASPTVGDVYQISGGSECHLHLGDGQCQRLPDAPRRHRRLGTGFLYVTGYNLVAGTPAALYQITLAPTPAAPYCDRRKPR